jgi:hypothetical protein
MTATRGKRCGGFSIILREELMTEDPLEAVWRGQLMIERFLRKMGDSLEEAFPEIAIGFFRTYRSRLNDLSEQALQLYEAQDSDETNHWVLMLNEHRAFNLWLKEETGRLEAKYPWLELFLEDGLSRTLMVKRNPEMASPSGDEALRVFDEIKDKMIELEAKLQGMEDSMDGEFYELENPLTEEEMKDIEEGAREAGLERMAALIAEERGTAKTGEDPDS